MLHNSYKLYLEDIAAKIRKDAAARMKATGNHSPYKNTLENFEEMIRLCGGEVKPIEVPLHFAAYVSLGNRRFNIFWNPKSKDLKLLGHELGHHYTTDKGNVKKGTRFYSTEPNNDIKATIKNHLPPNFSEPSPKDPDSAEYYYNNVAADYFARAILLPFDHLMGVIDKNTDSTSSQFDIMDISNELGIPYYDIQSRLETLKSIGKIKYNTLY